MSELSNMGDRFSCGLYVVTHTSAMVTKRVCFFSGYHVARGNPYLSYENRKSLFLGTDFHMHSHAQHGNERKRGDGRTVSVFICVKFCRSH